MVIYCAGPIRGDTTFRKYHNEIIDFVESEGHTALSDINSQFASSANLNDKQIYKRDMKWIDSSNIMIAEISGPSLGVGFEISYALFVKKIPVLALVNKNSNKLSPILSGCDSPLLTIMNYEDEVDLINVTSQYLNRISNN